MFLREITLRNLLSFGPETPPFALRNLNVLIGPNGSGKSNFIEAIGLLRSAPRDLTAPIREGGGINEWLWKGLPDQTATIAAVFEADEMTGGLRHAIGIQRAEDRLHALVTDLIGEAGAGLVDGTRWFASSKWGSAFVYDKDNTPRALPNDPDAFDRSVLERYNEPLGYPELDTLSNYYKKVKLYQNWVFGKDSPLREPQTSDGRGDFLSERLDNLGLVLKRLKRQPGVKNAILGSLEGLYPSITDFDVDIFGTRVIPYLEEGTYSIPAIRLSDGTLRYLCLLAILCHPDPPPLICIEEPEFGMHPDALLTICKLIEEASERTQLIITTHSTFLLDYFTHDPEAIVVCEKGEQGTTMTRLDQKELEIWLKEYSLGNLWTSGQIGGNRW
ncbi:AAA family ATPase [Tautonia sp. JC769]|uniref:AAA family ATPase n=1 Tax=Tautonia sp. JC769 TaxID=3232135 RepID=UPI0034577A12